MKTSNGVKLLIVTQAVDRNDPVLGFFCRWVEEFAKHFERIEVICLQEGKHELPPNVRVHSLGKESSRQKAVGRRFVYAWRFLRLAWTLRHDYDAVFVHMNEEYVLLAGWLWKLLGKRIYMWRNHYAGSWRTNLAAAFCAKVFYTSKHSYTARFKKAMLMPVGVDTERFKPDANLVRMPNSILFLARMAPSKRPEMLLAALNSLAHENREFTADFIGSPLPQDAAWYEVLKERARAFGARVRFLPGVPNAETPRLYQSHAVFVNASPSGMFDKTLFEAAACGCAVLSSSKDFAALADPDTYFDSSETLAKRLTAVLERGAERPLDTVVREHSLAALAVSLAAILKHGVPE